MTTTILCSIRILENPRTLHQLDSLVQAPLLSPWKCSATKRLAIISSDAPTVNRLGRFLREYIDRRKQLEEQSDKAQANSEYSGAKLLHPEIQENDSIVR